jgi:integrase
MTTTTQSNSPTTEIEEASRNGKPRGLAAYAGPMPRPRELARRIEKILDAVSATEWEEIGYDPTTKLWQPSPDHPLFGFRECEKNGCTTVFRVSPADGLCTKHRHCWKASGVALEAFKAAPMVGVFDRATEPLCLLCRVPGHERVATAKGLCLACNQLARKKGLAPSVYAELYRGKPRPSLPDCVANGCDRRSMQRSLCKQHKNQYEFHRRDAGTLTVSQWAALASPIDRRVPDGGAIDATRTVSFTGLQPTQLAEAEMLLLVHSRGGRKLHPRIVATMLRDLDGESLFNESRVMGEKLIRDTVSFARTEIDLAITQRAEEVTRQHWRMRLLGFDRGQLDFSSIQQPWLNEAARAWADRKADEVNSEDQIAATLEGVKAFSETIANLTASDPLKADVAALSDDTTRAHARRLQAAVDKGTMSEKTAGRHINSISSFLADVRNYGFTLPNGLLEGLRDDVSISKGQKKRMCACVTQRDLARRDLPRLVKMQLLSPAVLERLVELTSRKAALIVQLAFATGRRPKELVSLSNQSITMEGSDWWMWTDIAKGGPTNFPLLLPTDLGAALAEHSLANTLTFPDTEPSKLKLFPSSVKNPEGANGYGPEWLPGIFIKLREAAGDIIDENGLPFNKELIVPYSARHTWAQSHADSGVSSSTLAELLGHAPGNDGSVRLYYDVSDRMFAQAQLAVAERLPLDSNGDTVEQRAIEGAIRRSALGALPVPLGGCFYAPNVAAAGNACPLSGKCTGCSHLRTGVEWLPHWDHYHSYLQDFLERAGAGEVASHAADWLVGPSLELAKEELAAVKKMRRKLRVRLKKEAPEIQAQVKLVCDAWAALREGKAVYGESTQLDDPLTVRLPVMVARRPRRSDS